MRRGRGDRNPPREKKGKEGSPQEVGKERVGGGIPNVARSGRNMKTFYNIVEYFDTEKA